MSLLPTPTFSGTGTNDTFYVKIGGGTSGGVATLNGLSGAVSVAGDAGVGVSAAGSTVQLATVGRPVSASTIGGAWAGTTTGYLLAGVASTQIGNVVIGNTRIQWGIWSGAVPAIPATVLVPLANAYSITAAPSVFISPAVLSGTIPNYCGYLFSAAPNSLTVTSSIGGTTQAFFWMAVGQAV